MTHFCVAVGLTVAAALASAPLSDVAPAPLPAQILSGKKVFVSFAGGENLNTPIGAIFSGGSGRVYNQFYAAMKDWGRYELVLTPGDADLVFQIGFAFENLQAPEMGRLRLEIRDPRSNVLLWTLTQYVQVALRKGNRDKNLDLSMGLLMDSAKNLVTQAEAANP